MRWFSACFKYFGLDDKLMLNMSKRRKILIVLMGIGILFLGCGIFIWKVWRKDLQGEKGAEANEAKENNVECVRTGCNSEFCVEKGREIKSPCVWKEKYTCYQNAQCELQKNGKCGFTPTEELINCLRNY